MSSSSTEVQQFLETHELSDYFEKFLEEGYDTMADVMDLDLDALTTDIGMNTEHAKPFLKQIQDATAATSSLTDEPAENCSTDSGATTPQKEPSSLSLSSYFSLFLDMYQSYKSTPKNGNIASPASKTYTERFSVAINSYKYAAKRYLERRGWTGIHYAPYKRVDDLDVDVDTLSDNGRGHKVMLVIGETGTGKTTLLNSMTNYLYDVNYGDKYRFKLINEDELKRQRQNEHASMTDDVTAYHLEPTNPKVDYNLTVIDTPGFGDTRGLGKDLEIVNKIKKFFETKMNAITAICFTVKASNTRLTAAQKYIFSTLLGLFGKDIEENIFVLVTFCDAKKPPCIGALKATNTPYKHLFKFNNSAFFLDEDSENDDDGDYDDGDDNADFDENCWNLGMKSFEKLFAVVGETGDKGLEMTKQVLENRERLLVSIENLHDMIRLGTAMLSGLETRQCAIESLKDRVNQHKCFSIKAEVEEEYKEKTAVGTYTTLCMRCNWTCHRSCPYAKDEDKARCSAMDSNGYCTQCPQKCHWSQHANRPYTWQRRTKTQVTTDENMKQKYKKAQQDVIEAQHALSELEKEILHLKVAVLDSIKTVSKANDELKQYALRHNPVDQSEYIEILIASEKRNMKSGWQNRIECLQNLHGMLHTLQCIDSQHYDATLKKITSFSGSGSVKD